MPALNCLTSPSTEIARSAIAASHLSSCQSSRILKRREEYEVTIDDLLKGAQETGTILEINSYPERLDLGDVNIFAARQAGIKMVINTDTHNVDQLNLMSFGISQARRGWAEKKDIINAWPAAELLKLLK